MENRTSLTAQGIAILRAMESERPDGERLFYDPYARQFVPGWLFGVAKFFIQTGYSERRGPGVEGYLLARTRYIDDYLLASIADSLDQLVILGAGYDARAYRFADALQGQTKVFEVDHPATQRDKTVRLARIFGRLPHHVAYVPVDFNRDSLMESLSAYGYSPGVRTLFIWEGVTMYITPEAVDATLACIAHNSGPGSAVIFDYVYRSVIDGTVKRGEAAGMRRYRGLTGEGWVFGIPEGKVEPFLLQRGFRNVEDASSGELAGRYFATGPRQGKLVAPVYAIASAQVASRADD